MTDDRLTRLRAETTDIPQISAEPMSERTSFKIGGPADMMAFPRTHSELSQLIRAAGALALPVTFLGRGTNLLVSDEGIEGLVIELQGLKSIQREGETGIRAEAGVSLTHLAGFALHHGLAGLAFAHGIPGCVGGAVVMNAGAYGGQMSDCVVETVYLDENGEEQLCRDHGFGYRRSFFLAHPEYVVVETLLVLKSGDKERIQAEMRDFSGRRRASQPLEWPSAGSVFKRPEGFFAGGLIQECGLKGKSRGGAQVSPKHAGFIVNVGGATAQDVRGLIAEIQDTVLREKQIQLIPEIRMIGR